MAIWQILKAISNHLEIFMNNTILDISNLHLTYNSGKSYILKDISFSLAQWEVLSVIWKNGTGKSSLLKAIAWIQSIASWEIKKHTNKISYVPQKIHMESSFPLKVEEFFNIFNKSISKKDISESLELFDSLKLLGRNIHSLSGWEFQKVLIVNALLSKPELLLLDEPTSWIDVIWEEQFYKNIALVKQVYPKIAIILVSHNLHLVYKNSSRVICLHDNNLCCHGSPSEVLENEDINSTFWNYLRPYHHSPHSSHHHTH